MSDGGAVFWTGVFFVLPGCSVRSESGAEASRHEQPGKTKKWFYHEALKWILFQSAPDANVLP
jgi:hypothetical protein